MKIKMLLTMNAILFFVSSALAEGGSGGGGGIPCLTKQPYKCIDEAISYTKSQLTFPSDQISPLEIWEGTYCADHFNFPTTGLYQFRFNVLPTSGTKQMRYVATFQGTNEPPCRFEEISLIEENH